MVPILQLALSPRLASTAQTLHHRGHRGLEVLTLTQEHTGFAEPLEAQRPHESHLVGAAPSQMRAAT